MRQEMQQEVRELELARKLAEELGIVVRSSDLIDALKAFVDEDDVDVVKRALEKSGRLVVLHESSDEDVVAIVPCELSERDRVALNYLADLYSRAEFMIATQRLQTDVLDAIEQAVDALVRVACMESLRSSK